MSWFTKTMTSSLGKKLNMGITGLFLVSFLLVHCGINACIFLNDGGETFNAAATFMSDNFFIRTAEIVLFFGLIAHIVGGALLSFENRSKRSVAYAQVSSDTSPWYSRSMGLLGSLLLLFLILHLSHFWVTSRFTDIITSGQKTVFQEMKEIFEHLWIVIVYVIGCLSLGYHLAHGFQSGFQTLGLNHPKYSPAIKAIGYGYSVVIALVFAAMPIAMYMKWIQ